MGTDIRPAGILMDYHRLLGQSVKPSLLFPQFVSKNVGNSRVLSLKGQGSSPVSYNYCRKGLKVILNLPDFKDKHGLSDFSYGWHSFRVGSLSAQAAKGVPTHLMQAQARHANVNTTLGYINSQESEKARASTALLGDSAEANPSHKSGEAEMAGMVLMMTGMMKMMISSGSPIQTLMTFSDSRA